MKNTKLILGAILLMAVVLRFWHLDKLPVSLFGDEMDVGYQAYSILKTGKDYYGNSWPLHFHSLAEWRTPLYLYSAVPTVFVWGISPLGVRVPAAIFGVLGIYVFYLLIKELFKSEKVALLAALMVALSPWHIQYSRAGFEASELLFLLLLGLLFFYKGLRNGKLLWLSGVFFSLTPWVYSTAKLFTPILLVFLFLVYFKEIFALKRKYLIYTLISFLIVGGPIVYSTIFEGGTERFGYVSVFSDPTTEPEVGVARLNDARVRGEMGGGLRPTFIDRAIHNKYTFWADNMLDNYLGAFSTNFLFISGDPNLRHSIRGMGQFYFVEAGTIIVGLIFFATSKFEKKIKLLLFFWIIAAPIPASITRDGGNHATRLILLLLPFTFLIAYGIYVLPKSIKYLYAGIFLVNFVFYMHNFWFHNPWYSERWWHYGWEQAISEIKKVEHDYEKIIITTANEPPWIFFAGAYEYDPIVWQKDFPIGNDVNLDDFGKVSHINKFYFANAGVGLYDMGKILDDKTLYLADQKEVNVNLIMEPERLPSDLKLIKAIAFPSGEPAFYLLSGKNDN